MLSINLPKYARTGLVISLITFSIGSILKIQHWPFGKELTIAGYLLLGITSLISYLKNPNKNLVNSFSLVLLIYFICIRISLDRSHDWYQLAHSILFALTTLWGVLYFRKLKSENTKFKASFGNVIFYTGAVFIIAGALLKIQHWPGGQLLLFTGLILGISSLIIGFLKKDA